MKGKSIIELKDIHTGEVERYVDHNLVTNGMKAFPGTAINGSTLLTSGDYFPLWKNWFSGLRLFENSLAEDPENYIYKYSENITGYASNEADTTDPKRGLFNISESGILEDLNGVRLVWDFAQNQANGQISCIAIAPNIFVKPGNIDKMYYPIARGMLDFSNYSDGTIPGDNGLLRAMMVDYDYTTRVATFVSDIMLSEGKAKEFKCVFEPIIYSPMTEKKLTILKERDLNIPIPKDISHIQFFLSDRNDYYAITSDGDIKKDNIYTCNYNLLSINKQTLSVEETKFSIQKGDGSKYYGTPAARTSFESDGFLYVECDYGSFKVSISNPINAYELEHFSLPSTMVNGEIIGAGYVIDANGKYQTHIAGTELSTSYPDSYSTTTNYNVGFLQPVKGLYALAGGGKYRAGRPMTYGPTSIVDTRIIYTINNLATPVIKTADKTMKITYILTNE